MTPDGLALRSAYCPRPSVTPCPPAEPASRQTFDPGSFNDGAPPLDLRCGSTSSPVTNIDRKASYRGFTSVNGFQYPRKAGVTGLLAVPVAMLA